MPVAYVDVSSCWKFDSRWKRLHVTMAGIGIELFVAGVAMLVWAYFDSLVIKNAAADLVLAASVTTLLFNLNPLMKFDGYFAISDLSGIDNLYQLGQKYARHFGVRYVLGIGSEPPVMPAKHAWWIRVYGVASACWRVTIMTGILGTIAALLEGAGLAIAIAGGIGFVVTPFVQLGKFLATLREKGQLQPLMLGTRLTVLAAAAVAVLFLIPAEYRQTVPGVVEYDPPSVLRASANGFVTQVFVQDGEPVQANQPILEMRNEGLRKEFELVKMQLEQAEQKVRSARWHTDESSLEEHSVELVGLREKLSTLQAKLDGLTVLAPHDGRVVSRQIQLLLGTYVEQGQDLGVVGNEQSKRLKISLSTWESSRAQDWTSQPVRVQVSGVPTWNAQVCRVESRASDIPPDASLIALNGGNLAVQQLDGEDEPSLVQPRVNAYIELSKDRSRQLFCGQRCHARIRCWKQSLGGQILLYFRDLLPAGLAPGLGQIY